MKKLVTIAIIGLLFFSCKTEPQRTDYIINGNAKGVYNGVRAYLKEKVKNGREKVLDTAIIFDEKFTFKGQTPSPKLAILTVNSVRGNLNFMLENSVINMTINKANILNSKVSGPASQNDLEAYQKGITDLKKNAIAIKMLMKNYRSSQKPTVKDSITKLLKAAEKKELAYPLSFINTHSKSPFSLALINQETNKNNVNIEDYIDAFESLNSNLKTSPTGISVKQKLNDLLVVYKKTAQLQIGKVAPNFEAPTPDGKTVSLNAIKGKVTIIDFWASWCGPCRKENPNVVRIYNKYHNQGIEIIGVSLDGINRQKDPKKSWLDAIEKDKLPWTQVSHLQYFNDPVAQLYNIKSIPATYILDAQGKIVAKNLRGVALERKVQELLNKG